MAPAFRHREICGILCNITVSCNNTSSSLNGTESYNEKDQHALLYIVCTLLFYSLGIMVGIVSYIKREKRDIEQDRMFDDFLSSFSGKMEANSYRKLQVQETIERLAEIDRRNNMEPDCSNTEKDITGTKPKRESNRFYRFVTLSIMQPPVSMRNKSVFKAESKHSKHLNEKEMVEILKGKQGIELSKDTNDVIEKVEKDNHLNGEAYSVDAPTVSEMEEVIRSTEVYSDNNKASEMKTNENMKEENSVYM